MSTLWKSSSSCPAAKLCRSTRCSSDYDLLSLDEAFPPPLSKQPLAMH
jgi:hypothetical protein